MTMRIQKSSRLFASYLESLVDRTFKILPLHEENNDGVYKYIQSLAHELYGLQEVIQGLDVDTDFITLLATFEALSDDVLLFEESELIKREVFKAINIVKRMHEKVTTTESGDR
jgi:hypothetical protein